MQFFNKRGYWNMWELQGQLSNVLFVLRQHVKYK